MDIYIYKCKFLDINVVLIKICFFKTFSTFIINVLSNVIMCIITLTSNMQTGGNNPIITVLSQMYKQLKTHYSNIVLIIYGKQLK